MYDCMEGDRGLLFEAMVFLLSELTAQAGRKPSLVDNAYVALKEVIRDGVLPPGYQGSEQEIDGKLNMSRTPVHEAIIRPPSIGPHSRYSRSESVSSSREMILRSMRLDVCTSDDEKGNVFP